MAEDGSAAANRRSLIVLFTTFFRIGVFTLGGGYAMIPIIQRDMVKRLRWITEDEFLDIIAIAQSCPGPIAVNTSILVGYRLSGYAGALVSVLGTVLPSFLVILAVARAIDQVRSTRAAEAVFRGVRPAVAGLVLHAAWTLGRQAVRTRVSVALAAAALLALTILRAHPITVIVGAGLMGILVESRRKQEAR